MISGITQDEQDAIWRETRDSLRDIYLSYKARSGRWTKIARKMCEILYLMDVTETLLVRHPGRGAEEGSRERLFVIPSIPSDHSVDLFLATSWFVRNHGTALDADDDNRQTK